MAEIHVLDRHTAELIAAGEVVERPASVVKELTENAIDAGATSITVSIEHGGVSCIQIADNGSGIDAEYIPTAFVRHATSKIRTQEDLEAIHTLGFRGEALASVASVARVELLTCTPLDEFACLYRISGGVEEGLEAAARPVGTTITVRDLFYNTPARMKFLKKDVSEANYVSDVVTQLALSHPEVSFKFVREGKQQFQTPGDGKLRGAVYTALSREFGQDLLDVSGGMGDYKVTGCVTPPKSGRASRAMQFFFLNGRFVKNRTMMAALEMAYKGMLMQGKYPGCVLSLSMPAQLVDVNVHPAKTEVRFAREKDVFDAVYQAVKGSLFTASNTAEALRFPSASCEIVKQTSGGTAAAVPEPFVEAPLQKNAFSTPITVRPVAVERFGGLGITPQPSQIKAYNTMVETLASDTVVPYNVGELAQESAGQQHAASKEETREAVQTQLTQGTAEMSKQSGQVQQGKEPLLFVGEVFHTYIIAQRGDSLCFIDKHAAHERILYEALVSAQDGADGQMLLYPVTVALSAEEKNALLEHETLLHQAGVEVEDFGAGAVVVRAVPADMEQPDVESFIVELAARLVLNTNETTTQQREWVLHSIACRGAIKAGDKTHPAQLLHLAQQVMDGEIPPFCPHGRPVILNLTQKELEKQFGRQG